MKDLFILVLMLCGIVVNTNAQPLFQDHIIIQLQMQAKDLPDYSGSTQPVRRLPPYNKEQLITIANGIIYFDESLSPSILTIKNEKGEIIYTEIIEDGVSSIALPQVGSGKYYILFETQSSFYCGYFDL